MRRSQTRTVNPTRLAWRNLPNPPVRRSGKTAHVTKPTSDCVVVHLGGNQFRNLNLQRHASRVQSLYDEKPSRLDETELLSFGFNPMAILPKVENATLERRMASVRQSGTDQHVAWLIFDHLDQLLNCRQVKSDLLAW